MSPAAKKPTKQMDHWFLNVNWSSFLPFVLVVFGLVASWTATKYDVDRVKEDIIQLKVQVTDKSVSKEVFDVYAIGYKEDQTRLETKVDQLQSSLAIAGESLHETIERF